MTAKMMFMLVLMLGITMTGLLVGVAKAWVETAPALDLSVFDAQAQTSFIYDKNGDLITTFKGTENRVDVSLSDVPKNLINAVIAIEDQRFYQHNGIDVRRIAGALLTNLLNGQMQGGSTITQQVIKQTILSDEQTYKRKLQEAYLALQLEGEIGKDTIIEEYLNIIYLGGSNYGVQVAAEDYFGKDVSQLTLRECAMLARLIRNPKKYNPRTNYYKVNTPNVSEDGADYVLKQMLEQELITQAEYDQAMGQRLTVMRESTSSSSELFDNVYYVEYAIYDVVTKMLRVENLEDNAKNRSMMESRLRTGGYQIYTSLDPELQETVQKVVTDWNGYPNMRQSADSVHKAPLGNGEYLDVVQPQAAATVIDWHTGEIEAILGGRAKPTQLKQTNRAYQINMPVGSSLKPLSVYGPAFDMGYSPGTPVINASIKIKGWDDGGEKGYPNNYEGGKFTGMESMRIAINKSHNTATAHALFDYVGIDNSANYLLKLGVSQSRISATGSGLSLGSSGVSTVQMAAAFGAVANRGVYLEPLAFTKVLNPSGDVYIDAEQVQIKRQAFKESAAWMLTDVLIGCVTPKVGTGSKANFGGFTVAGKTGTNSEARGVFFAGMTGYYAGAVWIGSDEYKALVSSATGGDYAAPLWAAIMARVHEYKGISVDQPILTKSAGAVGLVQVTVCGVSGMLPTKACANDANGYKLITDYYASGTEPTKSCNMHRAVRLCTKSMKAPSSACTSIKTFGTVYIPEGHPLRNDSAEAVRAFFAGATTSKSKTAVGTCTTCKRGGGGGANSHEQIVSYAKRAVSEARSLMGSNKVSPNDRNKLQRAASNLQNALDDEAADSKLKSLTSTLKKLNQNVKNKIS
ncbi:MAG: hypothetical protein GX558_11980 [Clostridiales bacterium]|nr:hypothetical protein [Clostridiales bacterium]